MQKNDDIPGVIATATKTRRTLARINCMSAGNLNVNEQELVIENTICNLDHMLVATKYVRTVVFKVRQ